MMNTMMTEPMTSPSRRTAAARVVTNFSEEEKELILEFLQRNPVLYSKRLAGYKDTAMKENLWTEQAKRMFLAQSGTFHDCSRDCRITANSNSKEDRLTRIMSSCSIPVIDTLK